MKLGFITTFDANNEDEFRHAFSGIFWHMLQEFESQGVEIEYFGPIQEDIIDKSIAKIIGLINKVLRLQPPLMYYYYPLILNRMARKVEKLVKHKKLDAILTQSTMVMSHFGLDFPVIYWRDANFADLNETYSGYANMNPISIEWANNHEIRAMNTAVLNIFSSECSYRTSTSIYGIPDSKVKVIPYGANHDYIFTQEDIEQFIGKRSQEQLRLLFIGVDWERKGGDIAVEVCRILNQRGIATHLDIVGSRFEINTGDRSYVTMHGFVSKGTPEGRQIIRHLLQQAHFLIHPAKAEAYGCVLSEACSFGVPCISTTVGGIPTIIKPEKNGYLLSTNDPASDYADILARVFSNYDDYIKLAKSSFAEYQARLNWKVSVSRAINLIQKAI
ncbi:glycosyltransferase family 4 protein [Roseofilum sp. BLCC_M154]|uniref:Glycosyltransferase family 4 protein n=1 Tax=Roseofilum acuticapitatum BLCC-M154 TaxID=3022444 RepID=A0ABT7APW2_9CYAN|nr:glycosyltransferase family 4 protein [Roseofilum acuticapitatum]MDJ1168128.1 glycosyltransferase family 4 protein [Roseofilum acuticapitatum BLCC-M154]